MTYSYFPGVEPYLLVWFLVVSILVQLIWKLIRFIAGAVGKALSSWIEKLTEAFMRAILTDPEKVGHSSDPGFFHVLARSVSDVC